MLQCVGGIAGTPPLHGVMHAHVGWLYNTPIFLASRSGNSLPAMLSDPSKELSAVHIAVGGGAALALFLLGQYLTARRRLPHPPGPRPLPLIGNLIDMPKSKFALTWSKFGEQYGPLTWLTVAGKNFLILNSIEAAKELLDTRGSIYVDRPRFVMCAELMGLDYVTPFSRVGPGWRKQRTLLKHALSAEVIKRDYSALLSRKAKQYIECLLDRPDKFVVDLKRIAAENMVELSYGKLKDAQGRDYVEQNLHAMEVVTATIHGYIVDLIPALKYLPSWLPGMKFKRDAARWKREIEDINQNAFESTRESLVSGASDVQSCFMVNNLQELYHKHDGSEDTHQLEEEELAIRHSGFSFFVAGTDTIYHSLHAFLLAMTVFPSIQEKVHAELDRVVGSERPPTLDDLDDMPYLRAAVIENYRWCPLTAGGFPHISVKDDVYNGYFIPEGTTVLSNAWGISRNPKHYRNPSVFDPERYLGAQPELDPREFIFGYGRRGCPGNELAFRIIWVTTASVLWAFRLKRVEGDTTPLEKDSDWFSIDNLCNPVDFKCQFVPRQESLREKLGSHVL